MISISPLNSLTLHHHPPSQVGEAAAATKCAGQAAAVFTIAVLPHILAPSTEIAMLT